MAFGAMALLLPPGAQADTSGLHGRLVDATTGRAIRDGVVTVEGEAAKASEDGAFEIKEKTAGRILARAPGYRAASMSTNDLEKAAGIFWLQPFDPKALYLTVYGVGSSRLSGDVLQIIKGGAANALVVDLKGDRGIVPYPSTISLTKSPGARAVTSIRNLKEWAEEMHARDVYLIARIVVFKDSPLAEARPDLAIKASGGELFRDREGLAWTDPFLTEVRDYNIDLAVEAAAAGFDEIQFDYLRFPDASAELTLAEPSTEVRRIKAVVDFLAEARRRLAPYNVFLAADLFGYVCWNTNDSGIGQQLEAIAPHIDYLSPMLYPSGFQYSIPGIVSPVSEPYSIVHASLAKAQTRLDISAKRFRPWLQAFKDYAFDRRSFDADEVAEQIRAATDFGSNGWMLWNAHNVYSDTGLAGVDRSLQEAEADGSIASPR